MKLFRTFAVFALAATLALPSTADAKRKKKGSDDSASAEAVEFTVIEDCGVAEFDEVFGQARGIQETLQGAQQQLADANSGVAEAMGLATDAPLSTALADLKTAAEGKINVAMEGTKPTLSASDAVPANVQAGIDAVNAAVENVNKTVTDLASLPEQVQALVATSKELPGKLNPDLLTANGLGAGDLLSVGKTVKSNVKAVGETPDQVTAVTGELNNFLSTVQSTFAE